jgi:hypothetical protein
VNGSIAAFQAWLKQPFSTDMPAKDWFLFFGLLIVISVMWHMILRLIEGTASSVGID